MKNLKKSFLSAILSSFIFIFAYLLYIEKHILIGPLTFWRENSEVAEEKQILISEVIELVIVRV